MKIEFTPIGYVHTDAEKIPRHWTVSDAEGSLHIDAKYLNALKDIKPGEEIVVIFNFDRSSAFTENSLVQAPCNRSDKMGVFSICSPIRPNPIGISTVKVLSINGSVIHVKGIDMLDNTPILDIKPYVVNTETCPSCKKQ
ncbi:MAG: tRNA (N6-threonylcarbamoyladenosine(37)-N6)-methyltransferase TrmO [Thermodesulfobacteriota bacterium]|nr:tRNA (N6-threonylcarbamoyladenosine(37)-N6)-methyltransferase TrmO [Thermodesulfobacteriota bacterium]